MKFVTRIQSAFSSVSKRPVILLWVWSFLFQSSLLFYIKIETLAFCMRFENAEVSQARLKYDLVLELSNQHASLVLSGCGRHQRFRHFLIAGQEKLTQIYYLVQEILRRLPHITRTRIQVTFGARNTHKMIVESVR